MKYDLCRIHTALVIFLGTTYHYLYENSFYDLVNDGVWTSLRVL